MTSLTLRRTFLVSAILGLLGVGGVLQAGDGGSQSNLADGFFQTSPPCPLRDFPTFEVIVPVPNIIDPFEDDIIPLFCQIRAQKNGQVVKKAKGTFESTLFVLDNTTGMFETFDLGSGKFNTGSTGIDSFDFEIPAPIFADGFESGDVSAWLYTRADFQKKKKKKKADTGELLCAGSGSK